MMISTVRLLLTNNSSSSTRAQGAASEGNQQARPIHCMHHSLLVVYVWHAVACCNITGTSPKSSDSRGTIGLPDQFETTIQRKNTDVQNVVRSQCRCPMVQYHWYCMPRLGFTVPPERIALDLISLAPVHCLKQTSFTGEILCSFKLGIQQRWIVEITATGFLGHTFLHSSTSRRHGISQIRKHWPQGDVWSCGSTCGF